MVDLDELQALYEESFTVNGMIAEMRQRPGTFIEEIKDAWPQILTALRAVIDRDAARDEYVTLKTAAADEWDEPQWAEPRAVYAEHLVEMDLRVRRAFANMEAQ